MRESGGTHDLRLRGWRCGHPDLGDENLGESGDMLADAVRFLDFAKRRAQRDGALMDHRDVIGDLLHFLQQVRRKEHRAAFIGDGAKDGAENGRGERWDRDRTTVHPAPGARADTPGR